jgi:integrase
MRISEFCGLTLKDIDLEKMTVNIDHQLQRTLDMRYIIESTKTDAGTRVLPITEDVAEMFQAIIEDRNAPKVEKSIDGYSGFLFYDDNRMQLVAMHWQHRFNHMVADTIMISTWCRCLISCLMCADTPIAVIWQNQE